MLNGSSKAKVSIWQNLLWGVHLYVPSSQIRPEFTFSWQCKGTVTAICTPLNFYYSSRNMRKWVLLEKAGCPPVLDSGMALLWLRNNIQVSLNAMQLMLFDQRLHIHLCYQLQTNGGLLLGDPPWSLWTGTDHNLRHLKSGVWVTWYGTLQGNHRINSLLSKVKLE